MSEPRVALVTGASSGIGRALALQLGRRGVRVHVAARRQALLDQLVLEIRGGGGQAEALALDVSNADEANARVRALDARDPLDLVIASAGIGDPTPARRDDWPAVRDLLTVNLLGAVATLEGALPGMLDRGRGQVAAIASLAGMRGLPRFSAYSASKAGLITFLESVRQDLRGTGVGVTTVCPGFVRTGLSLEAQRRRVPFLVEPDDAAARILRAIDRRQARCTFPAPTALGMRALTLLPDRAYEFLLSHVRLPY